MQCGVTLDYLQGKPGLCDVCLRTSVQETVTQELFQIFTNKVS